MKPSGLFYFRAAALLFIAALPGTLAQAEEAAKPRKFSFNAYLTQAWGETDGGRVLGLDEDGTFDYRNAALLARYQLTRNDRFVLQLSHEKIGSSPLGSVRDDVEIDWAFYERLFPHGFEVRIGRVPIPFGVYNEIRDVGTLLEFYRPPVGIYFEGAFSSEAVDGLVVSKEFFSDSSWALGVDLYAGSWDRPEFLTPTLYEGEAKQGRGAQLWLGTPLEGLRFGFAFQRFNQADAAVFFRNPDSSRFDVYLASADLDLERLVLRAEAQLIETSFSFVPEADIEARYGLAGWRFTPEFEAYAMFETSSSTFHFGNGFPSSTFGPQYEDKAISMVYRFHPKALVRVEAHHYETTSADVPVPAGQASVITDFAIVSFTLSY
jgi:hypothetical protein